jgi:sporulation protein YlmC with PRC-barrel domain
MKPNLIRISDTNLTVAEGEDIRGRKVFDSSGDEIGRVEDLMIDDRGSKVRFLEVSHGGFLGIGESHVLVPVDAVVRVAPDAVHINRSRDHVAASPRYDPQLVDDRYYEELYGYYGYMPFWGAGYMYPPFPYYP